MRIGLLRHLTKWAARASTPGDIPKDEKQPGVRPEINRSYYSET